ncbi:hypothetical protein ACP70R_030035 [Stipagrostis hirtigluma subsp. patula]
MTSRPRDHFCPLVLPEVAKFNRARRMQCNRDKALIRGGYTLQHPPGQPVVSLPREYVALLKATYKDRSYYGGPDYVCPHCKAIFWYRERVVSASSPTQRRIVYNLCCRGGRVVLPASRPFPSPLRELVRFNGGPRCNTFMRLIRQYNSLFAFTSLGVDVDKSINTGRGPYVFRINGVVHHRIGSLIPQDGRRPEYAQLYIYDTENELTNRMNIFSADSTGSDRPDPDIVTALIRMLNECNPLVKKFRMARDRLFSPTAPEIRIKLIGGPNAGRDPYSLPATSELAALLVGEQSGDISRFDIVVESRDSGFKQVSPIHPALMALQYPLLFPYGDKGFHPGIKLRQVGGQTPGGRDEVTMMEFHCYQMHYRLDEPNPATCCGRLSQQYGVNAYSCVESSRLSFHFFNQKALRSETYQGISDAIGRGASTGKDVGIKRMLPASYPGSKRYMNQNYHDCMAICRAYGPPDFFTTFTCNANWPEVVEAIRFEPGQKPSDRSDMTTRVYHMKLQEYIDDIMSGKTYGPVRAFADTIEFQKRGLPHAHILVWRAKHDHELSAASIDPYISAEIPDPRVDPLGFALVQEFMLHGPCGDLDKNCVCMKDGKCTKNFPKSFRSETTIDQDGFPLYRRRDNNIKARKNGVDLDNRWVVPHNLAVLKKFQAHINVEACNQSYLCKYLFKYCNKGADCARLGLAAGDGRSAGRDPADREGVDEIAEYIRTRYLSWWMNFVTPFYLRMLLMVVREACQARGLIGDDTEWVALFDEAISWATPFQLRSLFMTVLVYCDIGNVRALFDAYWKYMADDLLYRFRKLVRNDRYVLPENILMSTLAADSVNMSAALNDEQRSIYDVVIKDVLQRRSFVYFVSGHGGTGKTFLWNAILAKLRSEDHVVLAVASSGVAALLLPGGRTAHSRFKIPLDIHDGSFCSIGRGTMLAGLIKRTSLIIWDEAPMTHRFWKPFGGMPILFGGDFRQVLPVIPGADKSQILNASLLRSPLWKYVSVLRLRTNMRLSNPLLSDTEKRDMAAFAQWVLDVGEGRVQTTSTETEDEGSWIQIPDTVVLLPEAHKISAITNTVYDAFDSSYSSVPYLAQRCVVCPVNAVVDEVNDFMIQKVPGCEKEYLSYDKIANSMEQPSDFETLYPPEFLNSIVLNNYPQHRLCLKVGVPIVLLRNIDQSLGLCNGTRLLVRRLGDRVLEAEIITGTHVGELVGIPRIVLNGTSPRWPFTLQRRQFPIRVCYAMTINKCQGQTLTRAGVYLRDPVFTHGQLYVAISRVTSREGLCMVIEDENGAVTTVTRNIVYREANYSLLKDVTSDSQRWRVKVRVVRFSEFFNSEQPPKLQRVDFIMLDETGKAMETQIPQRWIHTQRPRLTEGHVYYIHYFEVQPARSSYRPVEHDYLARLTTHTTITEVTDVPLGFPVYACSLVPFSTLRARAGERTQLSDGIGILEKCGYALLQSTASGTKPLRTIHITDGRETAAVSLWNNHANEFEAERYMEMSRNGPVVLMFLGVTTSDFQGRLTLQASPACRWYVNPNVPEASALRNSFPAGRTPAQWIGGPPVVDVEGPMTIAQLAANKNPHELWGNRYTIVAKVKEIRENEAWWYMSCKLCKKRSDPHGDSYKCTQRGCTCTIALPRYRLTFLATDPQPPEGEEETSLEFICFGPVAEEMIGIAAEALVAAGAGQHGVIPEHISRLCGRQYEFQITLNSSALQRVDPTFRVEAARPAVVEPNPIPNPHDIGTDAGPSHSTQHESDTIHQTNLPVEPTAASTPVKDALPSPTAQATTLGSLSKDDPPSEPEDDDTAALQDSDTTAPTDASGSSKRRRKNRPGRKLRLEASPE